MVSIFLSKETEFLCTKHKEPIRCEALAVFCLRVQKLCLTLHSAPACRAMDGTLCLSPSRRNDIVHTFHAVPLFLQAETYLSRQTDALGVLCGIMAAWTERPRADCRLPDRPKTRNSRCALSNGGGPAAQGSFQGSSWPQKHEGTDVLLTTVVRALRSCAAASPPRV